MPSIWVCKEIRANSQLEVTESSNKNIFRKATRNFNGTKKDT